MATLLEVHRRLVFLLGGAMAALLIAYLSELLFKVNIRHLIPVFLGSWALTAFLRRMWWVSKHDFSLTTQPLPIDEAEELFRQRFRAEFYLYQKWQQLKAQMQTGDELVKYSEIEVWRGATSGEEGVALVRGGRIVSEIPLAFIG